ncbi:sensor histidine kinase [Fimbriiglobus ruber]|uniref:histidine kinase n=1 Tax=Fimbriiglobus ruber TaxID=1908690 RepID=A0A225DJP5_9BACT|nr:HAMP domain-containing sensor histidine kinase [Fimbriiglobus ruber]OWK36357.1 diguanylate cyclase/phosphodiesterase (GGDEF & EAL domains) with PAS/PAC sensor(s) [Fimbriiglobus ruber]
MTDPPARPALSDAAPPPPPPKPRALWTFALGAAPAIFVWLVMGGWLATMLYNRANWSEEADEALVREWLEETRNFRKTLPELVREYERLREEDPTGTAAPLRLRDKRSEMEELMHGLAEPTRAYLNQLPGFPVIYRLEVVFAPTPGGPETPEEIVWDSTLPRPRQQSRVRVHVLETRPLGPNDPRAVIRCEYQLHAFNKLQRQEDERHRISLVAEAVLVAAALLAVLFVARFLMRERKRETQRMAALTAAEYRERELLKTRLRQQQAERARDELDRKLLEQQLDAANLEKRADEAEKTALEMKSQLYASIGIMAGSYAHNIKNLLVRPNDLLSRCLEADGMTHDQESMLLEVRATLGTVTERLQQILRTIRRDPNKSEVTRVNLSNLVRDTARTWDEMGRDKWKLRVTADVQPGPHWVNGDLSHLQQGIENLVFNARDATFEMRNFLREEARKDGAQNPAARKQRLIEAAGWRGEVSLSLRREGDRVVLEVRDNGIGMTDEVRANCLRTHFTTKRDNALYEGYSAGMGLGLSFVAMVLEHHQAALEIESAPHKGAVFRIRFPAAGE